MFAPVFYLSHGSPMRVLEDSPARDFLQRLGESTTNIKGLVVVSPHWETADVEYTNSEKLETIYDFYGFADQLHQIVYAPNNPLWLQQALTQSLDQHSINSLGAGRGLDHGAWSVLSLMYPQADIPTIGLSLPSTLDLQGLYALGQSLIPLREQGIAIITTGMATHNLAELSYFGETQHWAREFIDWLQCTMQQQDLKALLNYRTLAPNAVKSHPRDEHLRPLFIALGASDKQSAELIHNSWEMRNGNNSSWGWGMPAGEIQ